MLTLGTEQPFESIRKAEVSFHAFEKSFKKYKNALDDCSPQYDITSSLGPPFDTYYKFEKLHRMLTNLTVWMKDANDLWYDLQGVNSFV